MRVIVLTHGRCEAVLEQLLTIEAVTIAGVFVETEILRRYRPSEALRRSIKYEGWGVTLKNYSRKLLGLGNSYDADMSATVKSQKRLSEIATAANIPVFFVANFHSDEARALMGQLAPDLGVIYGTNIIKESVFKIPRLGSINLHQGLAPWYRGGPPVFWELYHGEQEVGITAHFVEAKVDSGDIVLQETLPLVYDYAHGLNYDRFLDQYRETLQERSASVLAGAVRLIAEGRAAPMRQDPTLGERYRLPTKSQKNELRRRLHERRSELEQANLKSELEVYPAARRSDEASST
jgi:folate-dependent phosphoribosylglycinamide formyltransferase PurN